MKLEQILSAVQHAGKTFDTVRTTLESHFHLESSDTKKRVTWEIEPDKEMAHFDFCSGDYGTNVQFLSGDHSTVEFWEDAEKRGITLRTPGSLSWEVNAKNLDQLTSSKTACIACAVGATLGFAAWLTLVVAGKLMESPVEESLQLEEHPVE